MKWILLIICLLSPLTVFSDDRLTLDECIQLVEKGQGGDALASLQRLFSEQDKSAEWNEDEFAYTVFLLSGVYANNGMLREVSDLYSEAMRVFVQKSPDPNTEFSRRLWCALGQVQIFLKDYDFAIEYLQQAQKMYEDKSIYDEGYFVILTYLGDCYIEKKDFATAKLYLDEAEENHVKYYGNITESYFPDSYQLLNCKGLLAKCMGDNSEAERCFQSVIRSRPEDMLLESAKDIARNNLALLYATEGRYDEAMSLLVSIKSATPVIKYTISLNIVSTALAKKQYDVAADYLTSFNTEVLDYLQYVIFNFTEVERENYWSEIAYQLMAQNNSICQWTNRQDVLRNGFEINSFVRDFNLNFQQFIKQAYLKNGSQEQKENWARYQTDRAMLSYGYETNAQHDSIARKVISTERQMLSQMDLDIRKYLKENYNIDNFRKKLRADDAIIDFVSVAIPKGDKLTSEFEYDYAAYSLTAEDTVPQFSSICNQYEMASLVYRPTADEDLINKIYTEKNDSLYRLIIEPLLSLIKGKTRLYIRPIGVLSSINLEAIKMPDGRRFGDEYDVVMVSNFEHIEDKTNRKYSDIALFGDPDFFSNGDNLIADVKANTGNGDKYEMISRGVRGNWGPLPDTRTEVNNVATIASDNNIYSMTHIGKDASETVVKSLSGNSPAIMHIATHGYFISDVEIARENNFIQQTLGYSRNNQLMLFTGLLLSGANDAWNGRAKPSPLDDGILTADEISRLDFSKTKLVVLSACDTGKGFQNHVDGAMGLQRAFRAAGASTMVMSLWQVPDKATSQLMQYFYSYLFTNHSVRESLKRAQKDLRNDGYTDPYYWAAFITID